MSYFNSLTDSFLVNKDSKSYKVAPDELSEATGFVLVNRNNKSYKCEISDIENSVNSSDLLLVNRTNEEGVEESYKITGDKVLELFDNGNGGGGDNGEQIIRGITWSFRYPDDNQLRAGSKPLSQLDNYFNDGDPSTGCVVEDTAGSRVSVGLIGSFTGTDKWKLTKIVYLPWNNGVANGNFDSKDYAAQFFSSTYVTSQGTNSSSGTMFQKQPEDTLEVSSSYVLPNYKGRYIKEISVSIRADDVNSPGRLQMAVGGLVVYGIKVDNQGNPI